MSNSRNLNPEEIELDPNSSPFFQRHLHEVIEEVTSKNYKNPQEDDYDSDEDDKSLLKNHPADLEYQQGRQPETLGQRFLRYGGGVLKGFGAAVTAAGTATNAFFMPSGQSGEQVAEQGFLNWWNSLSLWQKIVSPINGLAAEDVNARLNWTFFSEFWGRLKTSIANARNEPAQAVNAIVSLLLGVCGGSGMAYLTFEATQAFWILGLVFTAATFAVFTVSRYLGVNKFISRMLNLDVTNFQEEVIDKLNHLKDEFKHELDDTVKKEADILLEAHNENGDWKKYADKQPHLEPKDFEALLIKMGETLDKIAKENPDCFNETTNCELAAKYARFAFQCALSAFVFSISSVTFINSSEKAMVALFNWMSGLANMDVKLDNLNQGEQIGIGLLGGIPSAALYALSAFNFPRLLTDTAKYLYENPGQTGGFFLKVIEQVIAASGMYTVGNNVPGKSIFNIPANSTTKLFFALSNGLGGLLVNIGPVMTAYSHAATVSTTSPDSEQVKQRFQNPAVNPISRSTAETLRTTSIFQQQPKSEKNSVELRESRENVFQMTV